VGKTNVWGGVQRFKESAGRVDPSSEKSSGGKNRARGKRIEGRTITPSLKEERGGEKVRYKAEGKQY